MALQKTQKQTADRIAHLLAESPLDNEIKEVILNGLDNLPEHLIFKLQDALETEREELKRIAFEIDLFLKDQKKDWTELEQKQKTAADDIVEKHFQKVKNVVNLELARDRLQK